MTKLSSTELAPLEFIPKIGKTSHKIRAVSNKIGWIHSISDQPGASFNITVKDALGRTKFQKRDCKSETTAFGELINQETLLGEDLEVIVDGLQGAEKVHIFLN
jgi:hypothetical protein